LPHLIPGQRVHIECRLLIVGWHSALLRIM
jgi:hypothetical protein